MSMIDQFQKLDDLIVEHTQPPVRAILRNQLALTREQVEAYQAASDKQDQTLAKQAEAIAELQKAKAEVDRQLEDMKAQQSQMKRQAWDDLARQAHELHHGNDLNYNV